MSGVCLLPIQPTNCVVNVGTPVARWMSPTENSLGDLVKDLDEFKTQVDVTSIPDIWAGPKAFEAQLIENVEEQCVKWRAILAVIGLRKIMRFNLKVKSINVPKVNSPEYNNAHSFLKVVSRLMDTEYASYDKGDDRGDDRGDTIINLICSGNKTIAMVWPNSIIYPVPGIGADVKWWNPSEKIYSDPTSKIIEQNDELAGDNDEEHAQYIYLNEKQRYALAKWLKKLRIKIVEKKIKTVDKLGDCLKTFVKDLGYDIEGTELDEDASSELIYEDDQSFEMAGVGGILSQVYSTPVSASDLELSHVRLDGRNSNKHVLVVDEAIAAQWKIEASNITCFGATDLATALTLIKNEKTKKQFLDEYRLPSFGVELWTRDEFFTDKIAYISDFSEGNRPFPNSLTETEEHQSIFCFNWKNESQEFILPIRKEVLDYIEPETLVKNISIKREGPKSEIIVSLKITLSGYEKEDIKRSIILTRVYKDKDIIKWSFTVPSPVPNVQIWPNFKNKNWKQYYVFTSTPVESNMRIEPAWTGEDVENLNFRIITNPKSGINVRIRRGSEFPTVFTCQLKENNHVEPVGLICLNEKLLDKLTIDIEAVKSYIGVDFGTTNSAVYYANNIGKSKPQQMYFEDRNFSVTQVRENDKNDLRRYFFPANRQPEIVSHASTNSIRTIFHDFTLEDTSKEEGDKPVEDFEQPLVRGNIYYLQDGQNISDDKLVINELKGNIKWADEDIAANNVDRMHSFLYQLCLQAMAEAVAKGAKEIIWQFSWPSAYDSDKSDHYATFWETKLIDAMNDIAPISDKEEVYQKTESLSMADYFKTDETDDDTSDGGGLAFANGLLTIDIGGGSTDIAIWKGHDNKDKLRQLDQCSFKMAGTDIFTNYIRAKYRNVSDLLTPLGMGNTALKNKFERLTRLAEDAIAKRAPWQRFELELESILKYSESDLITGMSVAVFSGREFSKLNIVMRDIAFALGGIFYYAGSVIGFLRKNDPDCKIDNRLPDCFVGGNGSKLLDWASKGSFDGNYSMKMFLRDCIVYGMLDSMQKKPSDLNGFGINLSITRSDKPKHEVAMGLENCLGTRYKDLESDGDLPDLPDLPNYESNGSIYKENLNDDLGDLPGMPDLSEIPDIYGDGSSDVSKHKNKVYPVVSGELYFVKGSKVSTDDKKITDENFTDPNKSIRVDFDIKRNRFVRYLMLFNYEVKQKHLFNEQYVRFTKVRDRDDLAKVFDRVANALLSRETRTGNGVVVEPIFIMELREALKVLSKY